MRILFFLFFVSLLSHAQEQISKFYWPVNSGSNPEILFVEPSSNEAFFLATNNNDDVELWQSKGTQESTQKIAIIDVGSELSDYYEAKKKGRNYPSSAFSLKESILFILEDPSNGDLAYFEFNNKTNELKKIGLDNLPVKGTFFKLNNNLFYNANGEIFSYSEVENKVFKLDLGSNFTFQGVQDSLALFYEGAYRYHRFDGVNMNFAYETSKRYTLSGPTEKYVISNSIDDTKVRIDNWLNGATRFYNSFADSYSVKGDTLLGWSRNADEGLLTLTAIDLLTDELVSKNEYSFSQYDNRAELATLKINNETLLTSVNRRRVFYDTNIGGIGVENLPTAFLIIDLKDFSSKLVSTPGIKVFGSTNMVQIKNDRFYFEDNVYEIKGDSLFNIASGANLKLTSHGYYLSKNFNGDRDLELFFQNENDTTPTLLKDIKTNSDLKVLTSKQFENEIIFALDSAYKSYEIWVNGDLGLEHYTGELPEPYQGKLFNKIQLKSDSLLILDDIQMILDKNRIIRELKSPVIPSLPKAVSYHDSLVYFNHEAKAVVIGKDSTDKNYRIFAQMSNSEYEAFTGYKSEVLRNLQIDNLNGLLVVYWNGSVGNVNTVGRNPLSLFMEYEGVQFKLPEVVAVRNNGGFKIDVAFEDENIILLTEGRFVFQLDKQKNEFEQLISYSSTIDSPIISSTEPGSIFFPQYIIQSGWFGKIYDVASQEFQRDFRIPDFYRSNYIHNDNWGFFYNSSDKRLISYDFLTGKTIDGISEVLNYEVFPNKKRLIQIEKNAEKPYTVLYEFDESGNLDSLLSSNTGNFTFNSLKDELVYQKFTEEEGMEIWAYNLEKEEERLVLDFTPGRGSSNITFAKAYGDKLYFLAELSKEEGQQLWLYQMEEKEIEQILAVNEDASQELKIYPNPTSKNLKIASDEIFESYTIFNIAGRKMLEGKLKETNSVEVSNLPAGYYLLNLKNNESHVTKRFVIQN